MRGPQSRLVRFAAPRSPIDHRYMCEVGAWVSPALEMWIRSHS
jgi:hypothetical protein